MKPTYRIEIEADSTDSNSQPGQTRFLLNGIEILSGKTDAMKVTQIPEKTPEQKAQDTKNWTAFRHTHKDQAGDQLDRTV